MITGKCFAAKRMFTILLVLVTIFGASIAAYCGDLAGVKQAGVLRHLGVPYANFVTGAGDGLDVELMQLFSAYLDVKYEYVQTTWADLIGDLTGKRVKTVGDDVEIIGRVPIKGDVIANGFTLLPWRKKVVDYSDPTFPTQIWLVAGADSALTPIRSQGEINKDIALVRKQLKGRVVLGVPNTCLEPSLYKLGDAGAEARLFAGNLNELAPAVITGEAEATLLDVPDALIALEKWPGKVKVIGPLSPMQGMAPAFAKTSPHLRHAFNQFLGESKKSGTYQALVKKYYPAVFSYYPEFFQ